MDSTFLSLVHKPKLFLIFSGKKSIRCYKMDCKNVLGSSRHMPWLHSLEAWGPYSWLSLGKHKNSKLEIFFHKLQTWNRACVAGLHDAWCLYQLHSLSSVEWLANQRTILVGLGLDCRPGWSFSEMAVQPNSRIVFGIWLLPVTSFARIWTRDYREQIQVTVRAELKRWTKQCKSDILTARSRYLIHYSTYV